MSRRTAKTFEYLADWEVKLSHVNNWFWLERLADRRKARANRKPRRPRGQALRLRIVPGPLYYLRTDPNGLPF